MNVVFFLEPRIELSPYFRYPTLRNSILPQLQSLQKCKVNTHLIVGEAVASAALNDGLLDKVAPYTVIDSDILSDYIDKHYDTVAYELYESNSDLINKLADYYSLLIGHLEPDIIISWESNISYLEKIFPRATILYQWPGFLSRLPFPEMIKFDVGLLDKSVDMNLVSDPIKKDDLILWKNNITKYKDLFLSFNLFKNKMHFWKSKFDKVILFPLQIDNYFTVSVPLQKNKNQLDLIQSILGKIPNNIGVIFTEYRSKNVNSNILHDDNIKYLSSRYENFIFDNELDDIPQVSQYLVCNVDGVITISSSVGLQAALWQKPLLTIGCSHITPYASSSTIHDFLQQLANSSPNDKDSLIYSVMMKLNPCIEDIKRQPTLFKNWLEKLHGYYRNGNLQKGIWPNFYRNIHEMITQFNLYDRSNNFIRNNRSYFKLEDNKITGVCVELSAQISKKNIISFDIFDTLLVRPFTRPTDLFIFIQDDVSAIVDDKTFNFLDLRKKAELIAFENAIQRFEGETTIDEIYSIFGSLTGLDSKQIDKIKNIEIHAESSFLYRRESGYKAYMEAYSLKKKIILVSDMYLPKNIVELILEKNGYIFHEKLYISSETKYKKQNGKMFDYMLSDLNVSASEILHIGDNIEADVKQPTKFGITAFHLPKAIDKFNQNFLSNLWKRDASRHSLDWKIIQAVQANRLFDNPYISFRKNTLFNGDHFILGYYGVGALLLGFTKWIIENSILNKEHHLFFLARDGQILFEIYKKLKPFYPEAPEASYLLCSRRAVNLAKIETINDIQDLAFVDYSHNVTLGYILENRFGLYFDQIDLNVLNEMGLSWETRLPAENKSTLLQVSLKFKDFIFYNAKKEKENYLTYLGTIGFFDIDKNIGIVDIGYAGTMQESLSRITNKKLSGYYFITFRSILNRIIKNGMQSFGYLANAIDRHDTYHPFCKNVPLFETLFSSRDTSLVRFEKDWNDEIVPMFMKPTSKEDNRIKVIYFIQDGVKTFVDDLIKALGTSIRKIDIEPNKTLRVINHYFNDPHPKDAILLSDIQFEDIYGGGTKILLSSYDDINKSSCIWNQGVIALKRDLSHNDSTNNAQSNKSGIKNKKNMLIDFFLKNYLSERKYNKLTRRPDIFMMDIKKPFIRTLFEKFLYKYYS